jgi:hypothetical protein
MNPSDNTALLALQAQWALGQIWPERVPAQCTDLLLAGYDTPSLRVLAGLTVAELGRVNELLPRLFDELGLERPSDTVAGWRVAQETARTLLAEQVGPYDAARSIGDLATRFPPLFPFLSQFIGLWSEWDDDPRHRPEYEGDIRAAASELITAAPPPQPGTGSEIDHLVALAEQHAQDPSRNTQGAIALALQAVPAGHSLPWREASSTWTLIGSHHDRVVLMLHHALPFAFVRREYRRFIEPVIASAHIHVAEVSSMDARELSIKNESLEALAGHKLESQGEPRWLSASDIYELTGRGS